MEVVRIRVVFEERHMLSKTQRKEGLKRSLILLKPHLVTISDFSSYLLEFFLLRDTCPDGLILSMDGFILPPFESISILKDKDIVRVKKEENMTGFDKIDNGPFPSKTVDSGEGKPVHMNVQLLTNEELVKECIDCKNEPGEAVFYDPHQLEGALHVQRDKKLVCPKRRALKPLRSSKTKKNRTAPTAKLLLRPAGCLQTRTEHNQSFKNDVIFSEKNVFKKHKSSNRQSEIDKSKKQNIQQEILVEGNHKLTDKNDFKGSEQLADGSDDEEIVPVVIRPGHIRFEPLGQVTNQSVHPAQTSMETIRCTGLTIKKKEQKWGKEKSSSWKSNGKNYKEENDFTTASCLDFNKLKPCASLPKKGDIIAYRLIELSSSWNPELSSFRVGKVLWYKPEAKKIILIPVPEYPFVFKKVMNGESAKQVDTSPYGEDGSLKADFSSLIDIRIFQQRNSNRWEAGADKTSKVSNTNQSWNKWENLASSQENGSENTWDKILQALSTKKTELSKEVGWSGVEKGVEEGAHAP